MRPKPKSPEGTLPEIRPNLHLKQEIKPCGTHYLGQNAPPITKCQGGSKVHLGDSRGLGKGTNGFWQKTNIRTRNRSAQQKTAGPKARRFYKYNRQCGLLACRAVDVQSDAWTHC